MNAAQSAAFEEGTGGFFTAANLLLTVQAIGTTAAILYVAWLCYTAYQDWSDEEIKAQDMIIIWFRGVFVLMVLLYLLIN